jgi:NAD(P)-dependent dehydrogenase (short-subunit alcohol dehydrogenase family)
MTELEGEVAVVTGATRGIGREIALRFADAGADVAIAGRTADALEAVAGEIEGRGRRALPVVTDVTSETDVERLFDETARVLGPPYAVINNSGVVDAAPLLDTTLEMWSRIMDTNVTGTFLCTRAAGRHLLPAGRGKVVNVASNLGVIGRANFAAYCASKAAVISFTRAVGIEWARSGVQVNAIAPGYVETEMNAELRSDPDAAARVIGRIPVRRMASAAEIARLVLDLASPRTDYMVGETVVVDGGESIR